MTFSDLSGLARQVKRSTTLCQYYQVTRAASNTRQGLESVLQDWKGSSVRQTPPWRATHTIMLRYRDRTLSNLLRGAKVTLSLTSFRATNCHHNAACKMSYVHVSFICTVQDAHASVVKDFLVSEFSHPTEYADVYEVDNTAHKLYVGYKQTTCVLRQKIVVGGTTCPTALLHKVCRLPGVARCVMQIDRSNQKYILESNSGMPSWVRHATWPAWFTLKLWSCFYRPLSFVCLYSYQAPNASFWMQMRQSERLTGSPDFLAGLPSGDAPLMRPIITNKLVSCVGVWLHSGDPCNWKLAICLKSSLIPFCLPYRFMAAPVAKQ